MLDEAIQLVSAGETARALRVLGRTIAVNPWFWQAFQYRGLIRLRRGEFDAAIADFDEAIRLAPDEPHLRELRAEAVSGPIHPAPDDNS